MLHFRDENPWLHTKVEQVLFLIVRVFEGLCMDRRDWVDAICDWIVISLETFRRFALLQKQEGEQSSSSKKLQGLKWNRQWIVRVSDLAADGPPFI